MTPKLALPALAALLALAAPLASAQDGEDPDFAAAGDVGHEEDPLADVDTDGFDEARAEGAQEGSTEAGDAGSADAQLAGGTQAGELARVPGAEALLAAAALGGAALRARRAR